MVMHDQARGWRGLRDPPQSRPDNERSTEESAGALQHQGERQTNGRHAPILLALEQSADLQAALPACGILYPEPKTMGLWNRSRNSRRHRPIEPL